MSRRLRFLLDCLIAGFCCQLALTAIVVIGWTGRCARRSFWRAVARRGSSASSEAAPVGGTPLSKPRWLRRTDGEAGNSLVNNLKLGVMLLGSSFVALAPAVVAWCFAWWGGWNNSFHKGYEQAAVGPILGVFGLLWFGLAMLYVPFAQARLSVCATWSSFFNVPVNLRLSAMQPLAHILMSMRYFLAGALVLLLITAPAFFPQLDASLAELDPGQAEQVLRKYFFFVGLFGFLLFYWLRIAAVKWYACALMSAARQGRVPLASLEGAEKAAAAHVESAPARGRFHRVCGWAALTAAYVLWLAVGAQVFVAEFFNYHPIRGFLNHPLIMLPWLSYLP